MEPHAHEKSGKVHKTFVELQRETALGTVRWGLVLTYV